MRPDLLRRWAVVALVLALATGCGSIPMDGPVRTAVDVKGDAEQPEPYVRVFAKPPAGGESQDQIVGGFLEATGSVEPGYRVALSYLTSSARQAWNPGERITVYDHTQANVVAAAGGALRLTAPTIGVVDSQGVFTPARPGEDIGAIFQLAKINGEWRIAGLPDGIYISQQDFAREYGRVQLFFPDPSGQVLVPDPVFLPLRAGLVTALARSLLRGPTQWLAPSVRNSFPVGSRLVPDEVRVESGVAEVRLSAAGAPRDSTQTERLVAQLTFTLTQVEGVTSVRVFAGGRPLDVISHRQPYTPTQWRNFLALDNTQPQDLYYVSDSRVFTPGAKPFFGRFGDQKIRVSEVAASPDASQVSVVTVDEHEVWVSRTSSPGRETKRMSGRELHSPSYDQFGNLWVVAGDGKAPDVWLLRPSGGEPIPVDVPELRDRSVERLRVSDDGTRAAVIAQRNGRRELLIGRVQQSGERLSLGSFRAIGQRLTTLLDVSWERADRLVVVAQEPQTQRQPYFVTVDGAEVQPGEPLAGIVSVSAAPGRPLVAATDTGKVWELRSGGPWVALDDGRRPAYPG